MSKPTKLTPEKLRAAKQLEADGFNYDQIARAMGLSGSTMARIWLDPDYAEKRRQQVRMKRAGLGRSPIWINGNVRRDAMRLLKLIPPDTRDLTARIMGDPLPGRRAIDYKREMERWPMEVPFQ